MSTRESLLSFVVGATLGGGVVVGLGLGGGLGPMLVLLVPAMLAGVDYAERGGERLRAAVLGMLAAVIAAFGSRLAGVVSANLEAPPEWDFQAFRLFGELAARHLDFYRPEHAWALSAGAGHSEEYKRAILDVGFWYPPPTMLLFWPLGLFDLGTAVAGWYAALGIAMVADALLLRKLFLPRAGGFGLALVAALILTLRPTHATVMTTQTNFLVLLLMLLFWRDRGRVRGGVWLGLGMIVKPFVALLVLEPLLRGRWRTVIAAGMTMAVLCLIAVMAFGIGPMSTYLHGDVAARIPAFVFTETENQSLLATLLRWTNAPPPIAGTPLPRLFLAIAIGTLIVTVWVVYRLRRSMEELGIGLILCWALLVYPATLEHYAILLLAPLLWLWGRRKTVPGGAAAVIAFFTAEYVLVGAAHATYVFAALVLCFVSLAALGTWSSRPTPRGALAEAAPSSGARR